VSGGDGGKGTPAVFLDRDGVLNEVVTRQGRVESPRVLGEFRIVPEAPESVARLREAGFRIFIVTNQPDLQRGLLPSSELEAMLDLLHGRLGYDEAAVCPHDDAAGCECRKPKPGMLLRLADEWNVDRGRSYMVGDTWRDVEAGRAAGCRTVLLRTWYNGDVAADIEADGIGSAIEHILQEQRR
jgi:D-glycero-D-manno-heptose 1,7-bisphosphate phosphatase